MKSARSSLVVAVVVALLAGVVPGGAALGAARTRPSRARDAGASGGVRQESRSGGASDAASPAVAATAPITYVHDDLGRLEAVVDPTAPSNGTARYTYDGAGNLVSIVRQSATTTSVLDLHPKAGPVGSSVTVYGSGFSATPNQNTVTFGGTGATVTSVTATTLVATVPSGATSGTVSVTSPSGSATSSQSFTVKGSTAPTVTSFTPASGPAGTSLTITGTNFDPTSTASDNVFVNFLRAQVTAVTGTSITATVPPGATSGKVTVQTLSGTGVSSSDFVAPPSPYVAADVESTARAALGDTRPVAVNTSGKVALLLFDGARGQRVFVNVSGSTMASVAVTLYDVFGRQLGSTSVGTGGGFIDTKTLPEAGTYSILVDPSGTNTGSVTLTISNAAEVTGTITPGGPAVTATISSPGQNARYTFDATSGQRVSLKASGSTMSCCTSISILDPTGVVVTSTSIGSSGFIDVRTLDSTGTFAVYVDPTGSSTGSVTLTLYDVPADPAGTATPGGGASSLSSTTPGQNVSWTFSGTSGRRASMSLTLPSGCCHAITVKNPDGTTLKSTTVGSGTSFIDVMNLAQTGTYSVSVNPDGTQTGTFSLTVYDVPADPAISITIGGPAGTLTTTTPGQNGTATFSGTAGQKVNLPVTAGFGCCTAVTVKNPDGTTLKSQNIGSGTTTIGPITLTQTGGHTIAVNPDSSQIGNVTLQLVVAPVSAVSRSPAATAGRQGGTRARPAVDAGPGGGAGAARIGPAPSTRPHPALGTAAPVLASGAGRPVVRRPAPLGAADLAGFRPSGLEAWSPDRTRLAEWTTGRPASPFEKLPALLAGPGATALAGRALTLDGRPLARVTVRVGAAAAWTDATGRFLLTGVEPGRQEMLIDGTTASTATRKYGVFEAGIRIQADRTNVLPYTIWMPKLDTAHEVALDVPTTREVRITSPLIPGLQVVLPRGTVIRGRDGKPVHRVGITPIPVDRPPFPLPAGVVVPVYFTVQPGGSYIWPAGAKLVYPNYTHLDPGTRVDFWNYDAEDQGWYVYGHGSVSRDGKHVYPDPGVKIWEFTGAMINSGTTPPIWGPNCQPQPGGPGSPGSPGTPPPGSPPSGGDPVDLCTGLFTYRKTDLVLPGPMPIALTRTYRPSDTNLYAFGMGMNWTYGVYLWSANQYQEADLIFPDGGRVHYVRTSPGTSFTDAIFQSTAKPGPFYRSQIAWNGNGWNLTTLGGTVYVFGENAPLQEIRDRFGNRVVVIRSGGAGGSIVQLASTGGRWISLAYTGSRVTKASDNLGRSVTYTYDSSSRMSTVADPNQSGMATPKVSTFTWGATSNATTKTQILAVKDPRQVTYLQNHYDANGRIDLQTLANGKTFSFAYTLSNGAVVQTDATDPNGTLRRVTFDGSGFMTTDARGVGTAAERTYTYERDAQTHRVTATVDSFHNRRTEYTYDANGNLASITRLAGTPQASTTSFTYQAFNLPRTITDPLQHTVTFGYDAKGALQSATDGNGKQTLFGSNAYGQVTSITDPLTNQVQRGFQFGDLASVTDPRGRTWSVFVDGAGRTLSRTDPLRYVTRQTYDQAGDVTQVTAPNGSSIFTFDENGNLTSVNDPKGNLTQYAYDPMNLISSRTDALLNTETWTYDGNGNVLTHTDRKGQVTQFSHDRFDRVTFAGYKAVTSGGSTTYESTVTYTYDDGGRLTAIADSGAGTIQGGYDDMDRLTSETTAQGAVTYTYDAAGRRSTMTVAGQPAVSYGYDGDNRLIHVGQGSESADLAYDDAGRRTSVTLPNGVVESFAYDAASAVTGITYRLGAATLGDLAYGYDGAGRRSSVSGSYARTGLPVATTAGATYDADNRLTGWNGAPVTTDLDGNVTDDGTETYVWNARNQLTAIKSGTTTLASYTYDGLGRRLTSASGSSTMKFVYDGSNVVQELNGANAVTASLLTGLGFDQTFRRSDSVGNRSLLTDPLRSTVALDDAAGTAKTTYTYEPFGKATSSGEANPSRQQFTGRENDGQGLLYLRARYYNPTLQRFMSEDPLGFVAGDVNPYAYTGNDPVDRTDPTGLLFGVDNVLGAVVGAVAGGVGAALAGGSWSDIATGAVVGAGVGFLTDGLVPLEGLAGEVATGAIAGLAGDGLGQVIGGVGQKDWSFNWGEWVTAGVSGGIGAPIASAAGELATMEAMYYGASYGVGSALATIPEGLVAGGIDWEFQQTWQQASGQNGAPASPATQGAGPGGMPPFC